VRSGDGDERLRLFVAADLPPDVLAAVGEWRRRCLAPREELRLAGGLHLTLCFLGDTSSLQVPAIVAALGALAVPALRLALGDVLFLPEKGRKRVVALRLEDPSEGLVRLQREMSEALRRLRLYRPERRPFLPHLTVARFRRPGQAFPLQNVNVQGFGLPAVILYSSVLEKGGAIHTPLAAFPAS